MLRVILLTLPLAACGQIAPDGAVEVWSRLESRQCEPGSGLTLAQLKARLAEAGVQVHGEGRIADDGMMRPAVCGGSDGRIGVFSIPADDLPRARAAQFSTLDALPG